MPAPISATASAGTAENVEPAALSILFAEAVSGKATRRSLAVAYAMVIGAWSAETSIDLVSVHAAMHDALGPDWRGLNAVKISAWAIYDEAVARRRVLAQAREAAPVDGGELP